MTVLAVGDADFDERILLAPLPAVVDFWAEWCGPCKLVEPILEEIALERAGHLLVAKLNVDDSPRTARRFEVMSIPTLLLFSNGELHSRLVGARPRSQIVHALDQLVAAND